MRVAINLGHHDYAIQPGERVAQLIIAPVVQVKVIEVESEALLGSTVRGVGGFGSTGHQYQLFGWHVVVGGFELATDCATLSP